MPHKLKAKLTAEEKVAYRKAYYAANRETELKSNRAYVEANKERLSANRKKNYAANARDRQAYARAWYANGGAEIQRATRLMRTYGITTEEYEDMYLAVTGHCQICGEYWDILAVDHDHETGKVRGLLCQQCNRGIGIFQDDPIRVRQALTYLQA